MTTQLTDTQFKIMQQAHELFSNSDLVLQYKKRSKESMKPISDGHHTFADLYMHRRKLSAIIFALAGKYAWKSHQHADGSMFDDDFIVGVSIPGVGDYSYHYNNQFWDEFDVPVIDAAPPYDGHTPEDIDRLFMLVSLIKNK